MSGDRECNSCGASLVSGKRYCPKCGSSAIDLRSHICALHPEASWKEPGAAPPQAGAVTTTSLEGECPMVDDRSLDPARVMVSRRGVVMATAVLGVILLYMLFVLFFGMMVPDETRVATAALCHSWKATSLLKDDQAQGLDSMTLTFSQDGSYRAFVDPPSEDGKLVRGSWSVFDGKLNLDPRFYPMGTSDVAADFSFSEEGDRLVIMYSASKSIYVLQLEIVPDLSGAT